MAYENLQGDIGPSSGQYVKGTPSGNTSVLALTTSRVGIGATSPAAPLHIAGSNNVVRLDHVGILNNPHLWLTQNAWFDGTWHRITDGNKAGGFNINDSTGELSIIIDPNSSGTPAWRGKTGKAPGGCIPQKQAAGLSYSERQK